MNIYKILENIKDGTPYFYDALISGNRKYKISYHERGHFILSANNLKRKEILTEKQVMDIIENNSIYDS